MNKLFLTLLLVPHISYGSTFSCSGKVTTLAIGPTTGVLQVGTGYGIHYLCNLNKEMNGVNPETCRAWYSMFLTAKMADKKINQNYAQTASVQGCANLGNWSVPNSFPYWTEIID